MTIGPRVSPAPASHCGQNIAVSGSRPMKMSDDRDHRVGQREIQERGHIVARRIAGNIEQVNKADIPQHEKKRRNRRKMEIDRLFEHGDAGLRQPQQDDRRQQHEDQHQDRPRHRVEKARPVMELRVAPQAPEKHRSLGLRQGDHVGQDQQHGVAVIRLGGNIGHRPADIGRQQANTGETRQR